MSTAFPGFRCHMARRRLLIEQQAEAEYQHNEARNLLDCITKLERKPKRGRGQAAGWQSVHEAALRLLTRTKVQPAVIVLFSELLRGVLKNARSLNKRAMAERAAAEAEAKGEPQGEVVRVYAEVLERDARGCHRVIERLREQRHYCDMVEAFRPYE